MIYHKVRAAIDVMMSFRDGHPEPMVFKWNDRFHKVTKVHFMHAERIGQRRVYFFSVSDGIRAFRLRFCTESLTWSLEEVCSLHEVAEEVSTLKVNIPQMTQRTFVPMGQLVPAC